MTFLSFKNKNQGKIQSSNLRKAKLCVCGAFLVLSFVTIGYRSVTLATPVKNGNNLTVTTKNNQLLIKQRKTNRGNIFDRNHNLFATTINVSSLSINPYEVLNTDETISKLKVIFPSIDKKILLKKLNSKKNHVNLIREITPKEYIAILDLGVEGIKVESVNKRIYPNNSLASHVLGNTDIDGIGIAGIEKSFDTTLQMGKDVTLSIHGGIQHILKTTLLKQINKFEAEGGAGIIMDAKTGEIYALASLPDYNANNYKNITDDKLFNRATKGIYELGSTLKLITAAVALESGLFKENEVFDVSKPLKISSRTIKDFHPLNYAINIPEIIVHSSNIGSAKIAEKLGSSIQLKYLKSLGLMDRLSLEIPETGSPLVRTDAKLLTTMTISYGHGIAITPVHLTSTTATIVNGGIRINPTLLIPTSINNNKRIFSKQTSMKMKSIMRLVVSNKYGTAKQAEALGYLVGGKTGTAEKVSKSGGYLKKQNIVAFTAGFPMNDPRFVITVMIDNPKGQKSSSWYRTAGWVAAPVVSEIVTRIAPILGIKPEMNESVVLTKSLLKYKIRGAEL